MTTTSRLQYAQRPFAAGAAVLALAASTLVAGAVLPAAAGARSAGSATAAARVAMPVVSSVRPGPGRSTGGQRVTLQGANFRDVLGVSFGNAHGTSIHRVSDHTLTVVTPPHTQGIVDVRVRTHFGRSDPRLVARYCFLAPPRIRTAYLSDGLTGRPYLAALTHPDNRRGVWSISAGTLPAGLTLRGATITGTPQIAGSAEHVTTSPTVTFSDRSGQHASRSLSLTVARNHWLASTLTLPAGHATDPQANLEAVACPATGACAVTGRYTDAAHTGQRLLAVQTNAGWSTVKEDMPGAVVAWQTFPHGLDVDLSCARAGSCAAFTDALTSDNQYVPVVATLSGTTWQVQVAPTNPGATINVLTGIDCWAVQHCVAVGYDSHENGLIDVLTPAGWTRAPDPDSHIRDTAGLSSVTCDATGACTAFGADGLGPATLTNSGVNGSWQATELPLPSDGQSDGGVDVTTNGINCAAGGLCVAVGVYIQNGGGTGTFVDTLVGDTWTTRTVPVPADVDHRFASPTSLSRVTCPSTAECVSIGSYLGGSFPVTDNSSPKVVRPLIVRVSSTRLRMVDSVPEHVLPVALACPTVGFCALAGTQYDPSNSNTVAQTGQLADTAAATQLAPLPGGAGSGYHEDLSSLDAVSCAAAENCLAVGTYQTAAGPRIPLIETYQP